MSDGDISKFTIFVARKGIAESFIVGKFPNWHLHSFIDGKPYFSRFRQFYRANDDGSRAEPLLKFDDKLRARSAFELDYVTVRGVSSWHLRVTGDSILQPECGNVVSTAGVLNYAGLPTDLQISKQYRTNLAQEVIDTYNAFLCGYGWTATIHNKSIYGGERVIGAVPTIEDLGKQVLETVIFERFVQGRVVLTGEYADKSALRECVIALNASQTTK